MKKIWIIKTKLLTRANQNFRRLKAQTGSDTHTEMLVASTGTATTQERGCLWSSKTYWFRGDEKITQKLTFRQTLKMEENMMAKKRAPKIQNLAHLTFTQNNGISVRVNPNRDVIFVPVIKLVSL